MSVPATTGRLLTATEVAELLGFSPATVLDWWEAGKLPGFKLNSKLDTLGRPNGPVRFREAEIVEWLERGHSVPDLAREAVRS